MSSCCCSDRSALCGALQEVKHWNGEQDYSFATTTGWTGICPAVKPPASSRSQLCQWAVVFELSWVCSVFVQVNAVLQSFTLGLHLFMWGVTGESNLAAVDWSGVKRPDKEQPLVLRARVLALWYQADNDYRNLKHCLSLTLGNWFPFINKPCTYFLYLFGTALLLDIWIYWLNFLFSGQRKGTSSSCWKRTWGYSKGTRSS